MRDNYNPDTYPEDLSGLTLEELKTLHDDAESREAMHDNADGGNWNSNAVRYFRRESIRIMNEITARELPTKGE